MTKISKHAVLRATAAPMILGIAMLSTAAMAQTAPADEEEAGTIVVTGTLIRNPNLVQAAPVNVTTSEQISLRQNNVAEEVLRDIPGIVPNIGSAVNNGNGGASYVDLRGLGSFRNVVLLDGNRIAPSGLVGRVDLNNIPLALVERVEALTGGASTTYGADAVSGVVNFVTRGDFSGMELSLGEKITQRGDGNYFRGDLTVGANFDDGRGNATLSIGYQNSDPVYQGARDYSLHNVDSFSGTYGAGSGTSVPSRFAGTRPIDAATGLPSTNPAVANGGLRQVNPTTGQGVGTFALFNFNPYNIFQTPFRRFNIFSTARYEVTDGIEVYTRGMFSKNIIDTIIAPSGSFGGSVVIPLSNPYLPAALRNQFCAFDVDPRAAFYQPRFTPAECTAAAAATSPSNAAFRAIGAGNIQPSTALVNGGYDVNGDGVINASDTVNLNPAITFNRRSTEVGPRISNFQTTMFDYRFGFRGDITDAIGFDVSGAYGESENVQSQKNYTLQSRFRTGVYATNTSTCLSGAPGGAAPDAGSGCVPINIFGPEGSITSAMIPYLTADAKTSVRTSLAQVRGVINGDAGFSSPFASDQLNFAVGGEYRKYTAAQESDILSQTAGELGGAGGAAPNIYGGYEVYEAIGELNLPLVQDKPFFEELSLQTGIRYSSYKVDAANAPTYDTTTWKLLATWAPVSDIKFRGGYSRSVRAPNISELFSPISTGLTNLSVDPCAGAAPTTNATLRAVCLAQGAPAGSIGSINQPTAGQANATSGGNLNIKPETSESLTLGAVVTPSFAPGLSLTLDYYNIIVNEAITTPTPGDAITNCFGNLSAASASSAACTIIRRNPVTGALDGDPATTAGLFLGLSNQGRIQAEGLDLALNYRRDLGFAKLNLSFVGNYALKQRFKSNAADPTAINRECVGYFSINCGSPQPKYQWTQRTTLSFKWVDVSLQWRHMAGLEQEPDDILNGNGGAYVGNLILSPAAPAGTFSDYLDNLPVNFQKIPSYNYFDLSLKFAIGSNLDLIVTSTNIFDKAPPLVGATVGSTSYNSGNTYPSSYDALGRSFAATIKVKF